MTNDLNYMTTGACGRDGCACTGSKSSTGGGTTSGSDNDSDSAMSVYTMDDLSEASGISTAKLEAMDEHELEALAESVQLDDDGDGGNGGQIQPDDLSEAVREKLVAVVAKAREAGVDLSELGLDDLFDLGDLPEGEAAAASAHVTDGGSNSGSSDVTLTANTRTVAQEQGLPTNWAALKGIDLPPRLAEMQLSNDVLAKAINYAQGYDAGHPERVSTLTLNRIRDKGGEPVSTGQSLDAANAGERTRHQRDRSGPSAGAVKNMIDRHQPTGNVPARNTSDDEPLTTGLSVDDIDERGK